MASKTVRYTAQHNLCCGCGVCKGICPKGCISWEREDGLFLPHIDESLCVSCGLCTMVCPGLGHTYEAKATAVTTITGSALACYNAWSKDAQLRHVSASGGVVSTMVRDLIQNGLYDGAFCLDSYDYREQLKTKLFTAEEIEVCWSHSNTPKSRYLPVSHENAVAYVKEHRDAKLIIVGTSCAVRGLQAVIKQLNLDREQYLFIGLFCDKVFNYNVWPYFEDAYADGKTLKSLHFKNKESGGWPGDMKFFPEIGDAFYVPLEERAKAKAYFMPERCLYCVDKLNVCADISLGDNYTGIDDSALGSNSVIVRTQIGLTAWAAAKCSLEVRDIGIVDIQNAQYLEGRLTQLYFGDLKAERVGGVRLNQGIPREGKHKEFERAWLMALKKLQAGALYASEPLRLAKQIEKDNRKPNAIVQFAKRCYHFVRRRMKRKHR